MGVPRVIYKGKPKIHSWPRFMVGRVMRKNNNNLVSFIGKTGSGKTYSAISAAEIMSKMSGVPFTADNIVFSLTELMRLITYGKLQRGSTIIFDEPQASISSKDFQSKANKVFNLLVTTFRHRNFSLFFCTPFESLLDKSTRKLFHARFETMSINPNKQVCRMKPRWVEYSDYKATPYIKQLIVCFKDEEGINRSRKLFHWDVPMPSKEIVDAYEIKKMDFTTRLNANIMAELEEFDASGKSMTAERKEEEEPERKPLTERQEEVMIALAKGGYDGAMKELGITINAVQQNKKLAMKKGYTLEEFK